MDNVIDQMRAWANYMWVGLLIAHGFFALAELVILRRARDVILVCAFWLMSLIFIMRAASNQTPPLLDMKFVASASAILWFFCSLLIFVWTVLYLWRRRKIDRAQIRVEQRIEREKERDQPERDD